MMDIFEEGMVGGREEVKAGREGLCCFVGFFLLFFQLNYFHLSFTL